MAIVNLAAIIGKIRRLTGSSDLNQLPDNADPTNPNSVGITDYINSFYLYDFPAQFRSLKLKDKLTFNTAFGVDVYPFDSEKYTTVEMPCYCAKREIALFQDPWSFYGVNYNWQQMQNFATADGSAGPYSGLCQATPLIRSVNNVPFLNQQITGIAVDAPIVGRTTIFFSTNAFTNNQFITFSNIQGTVGAVLNGFSFQLTNSTSSSIVVNATSTGLTYTGAGSATSVGAASNYPASRVQNILITTNIANGSSLNVTDDGAGSLIGECISGTIDYGSGQISNLVFSSPVPAGTPIQIQYNPVVPSIPLSILYFQNQFTLRPVPDRGYTIELTAYRQPSQALIQTDAQQGTPELSEWWECIAMGAAKKIFEDRLDSDGVALMDKMLNERYQVCYTRTYAQLGKQRINTIFADQITYNYGQGGWGFSSGSGA
jgi:hypothetical protein